MIYHTKDTVLPAGIEVAPSLVIYRGASARVVVVVSNFSEKCVTIQHRAVLCELQQVELANNHAETVQPSSEIANQQSAAKLMKSIGEMFWSSRGSYQCSDGSRTSFLLEI